MKTQESPQVAAIRARYQSSLKDKAEMLAAHTAALVASKDNNLDLTLEALRDDLHKLAGSSGMYGYEDISKVCRHAMRAIDEEKLEDLDQHLHEAQQLLKQHA